MRWVPLAAVVLAGCLDARLVTCPGDVVCPVGTLCDTTHGGCVSPEQAQVCLGIADHEPCRAGAVIGYCLDQICVDPGCGNYIVEPGELCDDGNRVDGDGCSATCMSRERCGDGALDPELGEECDDGNLQSHDGCDSRCLQETPVWAVEDIGPSRAEPHWTTFDPQLGKIVLVADGYVWAWDGARWSVAGTGGPRIADDYSVAYDLARSRLVVIAAQPPSSDILFPNPPRDQIYEWDGTTWTSGVTSNAPSAATFVITYDEVRGHVFGFGTTISNTVITAMLDGATRTWTTVTPPNGFAGATNTTIAFDKGRGRVVVIGMTGTPVTAEWNGIAWTSSAPAMAATGGWSAFYDPSIAHVVVIGTSAGNPPTPMQSWNGTAWSTLAAVPGRRTYPSVGFDVTRGVRVVFGGDDLSGTPDDVFEGTGLVWTAVPRTAPPPGVDGACGVDEARHRLVCAGTGATVSDTWAWTGTWSALPTNAGDRVLAMTYDPIRAGLVAITTGELVVLGETTWQIINLGLSVQPAQAIAFDPTTRELVASITEMFTGKTVTMRIDEQNQTRSFPTTQIDSLAYDARNQAVVATTFTNTLQLAHDTWVQVVGPGSGYKAITNARRGTVEFVGAPHDVERVGSSWRDLAPAPVVLVGSSAFDQSTGELFGVGADGISRFLIHRRWQSATPFEDCAGTSDLDGDGLAGCDDPDCWTACTPACPPLVSCM